MNIIKNIAYFATSAVAVVGLSSCEDYLDKEPDSDVKMEDAFKNFTNFQGFVEEMYNDIPNKATGYWTTYFNWGEDEYVSTGASSANITTTMDNGDFKAYYTSWLAGWLYGGNQNHTSDDRFAHHMWQGGWYCIRKANLGLANMDRMIDATAEERRLIEGQLYFFRAWYYEELMNYLGGLPYIDEVLGGGELKYPRLTYKECALRAAEDFGKAAELLPDNWDKTVTGKKLTSSNKIRITRATALGYQGKMLLFAASPLSNVGAKTGGKETYSYDKDLAKQAAEVLGKCLSEIEAGKTPYALVGFDYDNIYDHEKAKGADNCYSDIFYTLEKNFKMPGSTEAMMRGPLPGQDNDAAWGAAMTWLCSVDALSDNSSMSQVPTANYVNYYGMANGLPLDDPESGFDPTHPFKNRDPRFYHDINFDGQRYVVKDIDKTNSLAKYQYATLYTDGAMREEKTGSYTGYFCQKFVPHQCNKIDNYMDWGKGYKWYLSYMRLAEVYLMYAEAGAAAGGSSYSASTYSKNALEAVNVIRQRCGAEGVNAKYTSDANKFMDEVRRERAVELAFEGYRFNDLQRWLLLTEKPYTVKTAQQFRRVHSDDWYVNNDPADAEVKDWSETEVFVRQYGAKHYWFPFPESEVYIYEAFSQNPGW
ncbi:MAG: RagB/SusD family nutrient uptake outer membrane protein [Bacteroidales bacterium]|nr:RagB/SusD family nutrient uptake outer membrane protein [Bacteroidales bacterium]